MKNLKELINLIVGFIVLIFFIIFKKQGSGKFYLKAQDSKLLNNFLKSKILSQLFKNFRYLEENIDKEFSKNSMIYKNDPSLRKYGDSECGQSEDINIEKQQRGLVVPIIREVFKKNEIKTIVEIGTGNGDVVAHLAKEYSEKKFIGIDFNTETAKKKHSLNNLDFISDYALDYFLKVKDTKIDLVFATSTFIFFLPKEIEKYLKVLAEKCKFVIISDPTWNGVHKRKLILNTYHLEEGVFFHNHKYYFESFNFHILDNNFNHYKHETSPRPDIFVNTVIAKNMKNLD